VLYVMLHCSLLLLSCSAACSPGADVFPPPWTDVVGSEHGHGYASVNPTKIAVVGDSITASACASRPNMTYPAQLQAILGTNYSVLNAGESGHTMMRNGLCGNGPACHLPVPSCVGNCTYWGSPQMQEAFSMGPKYVTIMLGTNDAKWCNWYGPANGLPSGAGTAFADTYVEMIKLFRGLPSKPRVYVVLPPPLINPPRCSQDPPPYNMSSQAINEVFPKLQRDIAEKAGADGVIDVWTALGGKAMDPSLTCDGCHPKDDALGTIARTIAATITEHLASSSAVLV